LGRLEAEGSADEGRGAERARETDRALGAGKKPDERIASGVGALGATVGRGRVLDRGGKVLGVLGAGYGTKTASEFKGARRERVAHAPRLGRLEEVERRAADAEKTRRERRQVHTTRRETRAHAEGNGGNEDADAVAGAVKGKAAAFKPNARAETVPRERKKRKGCACSSTVRASGGSL
jgi:hypothetical protein